MRKTISLLLIILFSILTYGFSTFTPVALLLLLPGLCFGLSITIPRIYPHLKGSYKQILFVGVYIGLWIISVVLMITLQLLTNSINDKTPYLIIGSISGFGISLTFDNQFGFKHKLIGYLTIISLSIIATLVFNYLYPNPHDKELNLGKQV